MRATLNLAGNIYKMDEGKDTRLYLFESDENEGTSTIGLDIAFQSGQYEDESVRPSICINEHETNVREISEMVGMTFCVKTVEEADEREDTFYLFEHEPLESYQMRIVEIENEEVHIEIKGVAITDGYADPYKTANFSIDCWIPI